MPKETIRFYSSNSKYHGWKYLNEITYFEILNWIKSGNYLLFKEVRLDNKSTNSQIFALLRRGK